MKAGREHIIPLSDRAIQIVIDLEPTQECEFVFPHLPSRNPLSVNAPRALLKRMGRDETFHGFRATFKSWATDRTNVQREVIEMALAHKVGSDLEASYLRTTAKEKRLSLVQHWADYCEIKRSDKVLKLHG